MNRIKELKAVSDSLISSVNIARADLFWMRVDLGCRFLELHFSEKDALEIATTTNFWDFWVFEFVKDDGDIVEKYGTIIRTKSDYERMKICMLEDKELIRNMYQIVEKI